MCRNNKYMGQVETTLSPNINMADQPPEYHEVTGSASAVIPEKGEPSTNYALLSFSWTDKIRLMHFPDLLTARVVDLIREEWTKGVQDVKPLEESLEIKLRGNPFAHGMDEEKIAIRKLLISILAMLAKEGWCLAPVGGLGRIGNYGPHGEKGVPNKLPYPYRESWR
jgi:hypothetical protein